jgi:hypothetical protein
LTSSGLKEEVKVIFWSFLKGLLEGFISKY